MFLNIILLLGTVTVFALTAVFLPPSPQSLVLVTEQNILGTSVKRLEILEGVTFSENFLDIPDKGLISLCIGNVCKPNIQARAKAGDSLSFEFTLQVANPQEPFKNNFGRTITSLAAVPNNQEVSVFNIGSKEFENLLNNADCVTCRNMTNSCKYITQGRKRCEKGLCNYFPIEGKTQVLNSKLQNPKIVKIKSDRCFINEYLKSNLYQNILEIPYTEGNKLEVEALCREPFPYPSKNKITSCNNKDCKFFSTTTCLGEIWKMEDKCERCTGVEYCRERRKQDDKLGNHCSESGSCSCREDSDCRENITSSLVKNNIRTDCRFGGKCEKPSCFVSFDGEKNLILHEVGDRKIEISLPHKSCQSESVSIVMAVMGGGGGSCSNGGCNGGNSGNLIFRKIDIGSIDAEDFHLSIQVGKGGDLKENAIPSIVTGPEWWTMVEAKEGLRGKVGPVSSCIHSGYDDVDNDYFDLRTEDDEVFFMFDDFGSCAQGSKSDNPLGGKLKVEFPNSGPILRAIDGEYGYECDIRFDGPQCLGRGGGGGGLSVGSDDDRSFDQPSSGFGSGGANGSPGQRGLVVLWSERG